MMSFERISCISLYGSFQKVQQAPQLQGGVVKVQQIQSCMTYTNTFCFFQKRDYKREAKGKVNTIIDELL